MKTIVSVSGGLSSFEALHRLIETRGKENIVAVFADVKGFADNHVWSPVPSVEPLLHERFGGESRDTYRFLWQMSYALDIPIHYLEDGRTIFRVFADKRAFRLAVGTFWYAPCSEALKRHVIRDWIVSNFEPSTFEIALGMKWDEDHRVQKAQAWWRKQLGWDVRVFSPLTERPLMDSCHMAVRARELGVEVPESYEKGFANNNCNNACVHAGQGHFANLFSIKPDVYLYWAWQEQHLNKHWGKRATILKATHQGTSYSLSLGEFIPKIHAGDYRALDWGACGCFSSTFGEKEIESYAQLSFMEDIA